MNELFQAARPRDRSAVERILICQAGKLDWDYVKQQLPPLCKREKDPDTPLRLEQLGKRLEE